MFTFSISNYIITSMVKTFLTAAPRDQGLEIKMRTLYFIDGNEVTEKELLMKNEEARKTDAAHVVEIEVMDNTRAEFLTLLTREKGPSCEDEMEFRVNCVVVDEDEFYDQRDVIINEGRNWRDYRIYTEGRVKRWFMVL